MTPIDFIVLTGFLGSGKTTLLRDFLALPEAADTGVIVNEVGQMGLDGALLAERGDSPVALLSNGCVCCSLGSDLERTIAGMLAVRQDAGLAPPSRMILETSGLAKPGPILRSMASLGSLGLRVGVVATFDCTRGATLGNFEEAAAQWAGAQTLVVTKRDLASPAQLRDAPRLAAGINPTAELIDTDDRRAAALGALSLRAPPSLRGLLPPAEAVGLQHPRIGVVLARLDAVVAWEALAEWLDNLAGRCGERLLRIKGLVQVTGSSRPLLVQSVGTVFSAPRAFAGEAGNGSF
ncbi:MAG TPA: GTP-binding protein, partial [Acetobacteraceae bacterium]|nr:GTP-binding protein [Acetobacteraceae bacterium]